MTGARITPRRRAPASSAEVRRQLDVLHEALRALGTVTTQHVQHGGHRLSFHHDLDPGAAHEVLVLPVAPRQRTCGRFGGGDRGVEEHDRGGSRTDQGVP